MRTRHGILPLLLAAVVAGPLMAQTPNAGASAITPYVDNQTLLAGRVDVSKIDSAAIEAYINQMFVDQHVQVPDEMRQGITMARMAADGMLARFKTLGGDRVYVLVSSPDAWPAMQPLAVLIPINATGDIHGMEALVKTLPIAGPQRPNAQTDWLTVAPLNDHLLYVGSTVAYKRLQTIHAQPRPDLESALDSSPSVATVVVAPTADMRRVVTEMMPRLPDAIGGGSTDAMAKDLVNITVDVNLPPQPDITLAAHTGASSAAAQSIADLGARWIAILRVDNNFKQAFGPSGPQAAMATEVNALLDALKPTVLTLASGSVISTQATVHISSEQIRTAASLVAPAMSHSIDNAQSAASKSNLHQIARACLMYMLNKNEAWPAKISDLTAYINSPQVLVNPDDPQHRPYVLEAWTTEEIKRLNDDGSNVPIAYPESDDSLGRVDVAFLDGHVERLGSRKELTDKLAKLHGQFKK